MEELTRLAWTRAALPHALRLSADRMGLGQTAPQLGPGADTAELPVLAAELGLELEHVGLSYREIRRRLGRIAPAVVQLTHDEEQRFLIITRSRGSRLHLLTPDGGTTTLPQKTLVAHLCATLEAPYRDEVAGFLAGAEIAAARRTKAAEMLMMDRIGAQMLPGIWLLRTPIGAPLRHHLRDTGALRSVIALLGCHALQYVFMLTAWWLIGRALLGGDMAAHWLLPWGLLLISRIPLILAVRYLQGAVSISLGGFIKRRLLAGVLRLEPERMRRLGAGQLFGRVMDSEALETLALNGGILALLSSVELAIAGLVLSQTGPWLPTMLVLWLTATAYQVRRLYRTRRAWTDIRLAMTHDMVENMIGYRTRLAQQPLRDLHREEDVALGEFITASVAMDRATNTLFTLMPRGWLLAATTVFAVQFVSVGTATATTALSLGGILLVWQALVRLTNGGASLSSAAIAAERIRALYTAAATQTSARSAGPLPEPAQGETLVEAHQLSFAHSGREALLDNVHFEIRQGDHLLLEGPSGSGKSTLVSLLAGMYQAQSGLLFVRGQDARALDATSRRRAVVAVPQCHQNHIFTGTFMFNLVLGCDWPPTESDHEHARQLCHELGLDDVLDRMPARERQLVGETGWQLSHGERARVFLARALLQQPDIVVLDESLAALDAENKERTLQCVLRHAKTLILVAHR